MNKPGSALLRNFRHVNLRNSTKRHGFSIGFWSFISGSRSLIKSLKIRGGLQRLSKSWLISTGFSLKPRFSAGLEQV
jgi:hypothetical protein